ncbi:hypothetical protein ACTXT7_009758 [Hymenolepis weldensis]
MQAIKSNLLSTLSLDILLPPYQAFKLWDEKCLVTNVASANVFRLATIISKVGNNFLCVIRCYDPPDSSSQLLEKETPYRQFYRLLGDIRPKFDSVIIMDDLNCRLGPDAHKSFANANHSQASDDAATKGLKSKIRQKGEGIDLISKHKASCKEILENIMQNYGDLVKAIAKTATSIC